jgi:IS4 transposase
MMKMLIHQQYSHAFHHLSPSKRYQKAKMSYLVYPRVNSQFLQPETINHQNEDSLLELAAEEVNSMASQMGSTLRSSQK